MATHAYVIHDHQHKTLGIQVGGDRPTGVTIKVEVVGMTDVDARLYAIGMVCGTWPTCWPEILDLAQGRLEWADDDMPAEVVEACRFLREDYIAGRRHGPHSWAVFSAKTSRVLLKRVREYRQGLLAVEREGGKSDAC